MEPIEDDDPNSLMQSIGGFAHAKPKNFDEIATAVMDPEGTFKYILIKIVDKPSGKERIVVRGYAHCGFHADILALFQCQELVDYQGSSDLDVECIGGGRIRITKAVEGAGNHELYIYGYSVGFGRADHQVTQDLLTPEYPGYNITWSNEGY